MDAFIARQPILDRNRELYGYELLFRSGADNFFRPTDGDHATASLINDAVHLHSLEKLTGAKMCFINFTRKSLVEAFYTLLPPATTVVEVLETVDVDRELLESCRQLKKLGYTLALDDYVLEDRFAPLLPLIDLLKVEFPALTSDQHLTVVQSARHHKYQLLAEKVETYEQFELGLKLGYDYFQGYFFCKPQLKRTRRIPRSHAHCLQLLRKVNEPDFDVDELEKLFRGDLALSFKLLKYLNSPLFGRPRDLNSVRHGILMLGQKPLRRWVALITVEDLASEKPHELVITCLARARFCELVGLRVLGGSNSGDCFLVGMFSLLDALLDQPLDQLANELNLAEPLRLALQGHYSQLLPFLKLAAAMERADWTVIGNLSEGIGLSSAEAMELYQTGVEWAAMQFKQPHEQRCNLPVPEIHRPVQARRLRPAHCATPEIPAIIGQLQWSFFESQVRNMNRNSSSLPKLVSATAGSLLVFAVFLLSASRAVAADTLVFAPANANDSAKHVVLVAGDEEYRSEESLPMLAKILSQKHGFRCTVVFALGPDGADYIDANNQQGLRGLDALQSADLMIIATRFRQPDPEQAGHIAAFLNAGKPVIGLRTATHAFRGGQKLGESLTYDNFGLKILGEQWVSHHGGHKTEGARGVIEHGAETHPILNSVRDVFAPSDVYGVIHLTDADKILMRGAVTASLDPKSENVDDKRNQPMQPLAWLHSYQSPDGKVTGHSFCTTAGASVDFVSEDLRRMVINAALHLTGRDIPAKADVDYVDPFYPSFYGFINDKTYWKETNIKPADFGLGKSPSLPDPKGSPPWPFRPMPPAK